MFSFKNAFVRIDSARGRSEDGAVCVFYASKVLRDVGRSVRWLFDTVQIEKTKNIKRVAKIGDETWVLLCEKTAMDRNSLLLFLEENKEHHGISSESVVEKTIPNEKTPEDRREWPLQKHKHTKTEKELLFEDFTAKEQKQSVGWFEEMLHAYTEQKIENIALVVDMKQNRCVSQEKHGGGMKHCAITALRKTGELEDKEQYLCTGLDVFVYREPCIMCSMALIHFRVRRVFFCVPNTCAGGLFSVKRLQTLSAINHKLSVFMFNKNGERE
ncbi:MAG: tRNA-specific adenosine deaminase-like protein 3 [Amphiamblys sp. WSBS2006]|nr:MAG: tRNA-specific adenosine deaminase-like protein 3 [Amphiamblys sp. WSBS2006]